MDGGLATTTLVGKVSTRFAVSAVAEALPLPSVIVRVETPPAKTVAGEKDLLTLGGCVVGDARFTCNGAFVSTRLVPNPVCNWPAAMLLVYVPANAEVTFTAIAHPPAGMPPPLW